MLDLIFLAGGLCLFPYMSVRGFRSLWVTFSLLCLVALMGTYLFLPESDIHTWKFKEIKTLNSEVDIVEDGVTYSKEVYTYSCQASVEQRVIYHNWFLLTDMFRHAPFPQEVLIEGKKCDQVEGGDEK